MAKTYQEVLQSLKQHVSDDLFQASLRVLSYRLQVDKIYILTHLSDSIPSNIHKQWLSDIEELKKNKPVQYIIGEEIFYGRPFKVTQDTLIPRPETELLVELVLQKLKNKITPSIIDIGTGTGCIGISLKLEKADATVTLTDISEKALSVAKENAHNLKADVTCCQSDLLKQVSQTFDCIVSNPPYIAYSEIDVMDKSVLQYEPHIALFAQDNGLLYYKRLAKEAPKHLAMGGILCVEIGYQQAEAVKQLFQKAFPNKKVYVQKDYAGCDRLVIVE